MTDGGRPSRPETVPLRDDADVIYARQKVREAAQLIGFDLVSQTKVVTASSELSRNTVIHGRGGELTIEHVEQEASGQAGLRLTFVDQGPGIANIEQAMVGGWSSGTGLGLGLPGSRRLVHDFEISSTAGNGTTVVITMWRRG